MKDKIVVTGSNGRFAKILKLKNKKLNLVFADKKKLNILNLSSIIKFIRLNKPKTILHCAGLSRPMNIHNIDIKKSIDLNIIGTANITKVCEMFNLKLIYFSTGYVYSGNKKNFKETDPVKPFNNYGLSKMGGECAVQMYSNSLILRLIMTEKPFAYNKAYSNLKSNYMFHEEVVKILPKLINKKGIINVGGKAQSIFNFAKLYNPKIKRIIAKKNKNFPLDQTMSVAKLNKILNK